MREPFGSSSADVVFLRFIIFPILLLSSHVLVVIHTLLSILDRSEEDKPSDLAF